MGGYYARAEGLPDEVADAIRDHYKPVGQGDEVPTAPVTVAVSLADKLDTLIEFFAIDEKPTGSKDPFALRRAALGVIQLIFGSDLRLRIAQVVSHRTSGRVMSESAHRIERQIVDFFADRLKVQQREAGVRHDLIDAVTVLVEEDDLVRLLTRVHALQAFVGTEDGANLLAGYKRAANILKKEGWGEHALVTPAKAGVQSDKNASRSDTPSSGLDSRLRGNDERGGIPQDGEEDPFAMVDDPDVAAAVRARAEVQKKLSYTPEPAEQSLIDALDSAELRARAAIADEDFAGAMAALASLRAPIDRFFDEVTVNEADLAKRTARLDLLARFRDAVHQVADFGRIEG
jgi:glycyl-tRNA synthetase beta chain